MKLTTRFLVPLLLAGLIPATTSADDRYDRHDQYAKHKYAKHKDDDKHDRSGRYDERSLRNLAHDLEGLTRAAYKEAERQQGDRYRDDGYRYRDRNRGSDPLYALGRLAVEARDFRHDVDQSSKDRRLSRGDWDQLERAYVDASRSMSGLRADRRVRDIFERVDDTMDRLAYYYDDSRRGDWRASDRYRAGDRDRYDRYDDRDYDRDDYDRTHRPH
jgi:hypothetical protein